MRSARATRSWRAPSRVHKRARQPVAGVVGQADRLGLVPEPDHRNDRAEDLLARDGHVVGGAVEHRRSQEVAGPERASRPLPTGHDPGALIDATSDVALDGVTLAGRDHRPDLGLGVRRHSHPDRGGGGRVALDHLVLDRLLDQQPGTGAAILATVLEHGEWRQRADLLEIGIGEDDAGRLAAQLQGDALDGAGRPAGDLGANLGRTGEADLSDQWMLHECVTDLRSWPGNHVQHTVGDAGLKRQLAIAKRRQRGQRRGLQDHGVARSHRGRGLPVGDVQRKVPGSDQADHTDRLAKGHGDTVAFYRHRVPEELVDRARVVANHVDDHAELAASVRDWHAHIARLELGEFLGVLLQDVGKPVHVTTAGDR